MFGLAFSSLGDFFAYGPRPLLLLGERLSHTTELRFQAGVIHLASEGNDHSAEEIGVNLNGWDHRFFREMAKGFDH